MPTLGLAPNPDEVESMHEGAGDRLRPDNVQENQGTGRISDARLRAVSPGANPVVGGDDKPAAQNGQQRTDVRHPAEEGYSFIKSSDYDITLSLREDVMYKMRIEEARDMLWNEGNRGQQDPSPKDLAQKMLEEMKREIEPWGGSIYRLTAGGNSYYEARDHEALKKIIADLNNCKKRKKTHSYEETSPDDGNDDDPLRQSPKKMPEPPEDDSELILNCWDDSYRDLINCKVEQLLGGLRGRSIATIASEEIEAVRRKGCRLFNFGKGSPEREEMDDESARTAMAERIQYKLIQARRSDDRVVIISKKNKKYADAVAKGAEAFAEEKDKPAAGARAEAISKMLMEEFKSAGVIHFFRIARDDDEISQIEVLEKLTKDIQADARFVHPSLPNGVNHEDKFISSTRKRTINTVSEGPFIHCSPREFIWDYIVSYLRPYLANYGLLDVKQKVINQLDVWVAHRVKPTANAGDCSDDLIGWENILDEVYICGFYQDKILGTQQGRDVLQDAKILEDPYSIFSEELRSRQKRRKLEQGPLMEPLAPHHEILAVEEAPGVEVGGSKNVLSIRSARIPDPPERTEPIESVCELHGESNKTGHDGEASGMGCAVGGPMRGASKDAGQERDAGSDKRPYGANGIPTDGNMNIQSKSDISAAQGRGIDDGDTTIQPEQGTEPVQGTGPSYSASSQTKDNDANSGPELRNDTDQGTKMLRQNCFSVHLSNAMEATDQVMQMYKHIKAKLLSAKQSVNRAHLSSSCSSVNNDGSKKLELHIGFYGHLKRWLAQRGGMVELSDLNDIQKLMGRFESVIEEMEDSDNDEDDILCYTNVCERFIEKCKRALPV